MLPINKILSDLMNFDSCYLMIFPKEKSIKTELLKFYHLQNADDLTDVNTFLTTLNLSQINSIFIVKNPASSNDPIFEWFNPQSEQKATKHTEGEFYTKLLDWQIKQQEQNEDRLDRRLKELLKTATAERNIPQQSGMDLSSILPMLQPILQKLQEGK